MRYRVISSHNPTYPEALVVRKGEKLQYERKPTEWPGWIWCTAEDGNSAWIPESWATLTDEFCVMLRDYNSRELSVEPGEELEVMFEESGWVWARNLGDNEGWIPKDHLEIGSKRDRSGR